MSKGVTVDGDFDAVLDALEEGVVEAAETTGRASLAKIQESFDQEETPQGTPWTPLSPVTIDLSQHSAAEKSILVEEGDLRESFDAVVQDPDRSGASVSLVVGSDDPKLPYHEYGTEDIPKRPILDPLAHWWDEDAVEDIFAPVLEEHIEGAVRT